MILFVLAYLGGALTIVSPCILPVLPFVFARADRPFLRSGLPMLIGMALTFAAVATLAAVAGGWAVAANQYGRDAALALLALFGLMLLFPGLADRAARPLVALGVRLSDAAGPDASRISLLPSLLLGVATGLLWAPCAGPILGLILTGAALRGANAQTSLLLLTFAGGAATSLALALLLGGQVFAGMKRSLGAGEWVRRALGAAVLAGVAAIALGLDTGFLTRISSESTAALEQGLLDKMQPPQATPSVVMSGGPAMMSGNPAMMSGNNPAMMSGNPAMMGPGAGMMMKGAPGASSGQDLPIEGALPPLTGATEWLNSPELTPEALKGKVVLIDFWTYSCINCLRAIPYVRAWSEKYKDRGLVVIGVHTPEFAFEKDPANVRRAVSDLKIAYPVAIDSNYAIWRAFSNQYWPAHYFIDAHGQIRHHHFGEGEYDESERVIQQLLAEAGNGGVATDLVSVKASGVEAASDEGDVRSPETYVGYERAENFVSPGGAVENAAHAYASGSPRLNEWGLTGDWTVGAENAVLDQSGGSIVYRFHARDLHLVLGAAADGKPVRFRVTIDGAAPGDNHGADVASDGTGTVTDYRLYQLVRQTGAIGDRTFEIQFLDPGVRAFAFTFG
jgi:cytochrome c biogenesis protein CcdA/thiol-disulfide isomerase/thioredoxin